MSVFMYTFIKITLILRRTIPTPRIRRRRRSKKPVIITIPLQLFFFVFLWIPLPLLPVQHLTHPSHRDIHHRVRPLTPDVLPVPVRVRRAAVLHRPHRLRCRCPWFHLLRSSRPPSPLAVDHRDVGRFVHDVLDAVHRQRQIPRVVRRERHVDVHDRHDEVGRDGERPPPVWVVVDPQLVQEGGGEVRPEEVDY